MESVLDHWLAALSELQSTISKFSTACTALNTATLTMCAADSVPSSLEPMLALVHAKIGIIDEVEAAITESRRTLNPLHNLSTSLVPIHRLPTEILSRIFLNCISITPCHPPWGDYRKDGYLRDVLDIIPSVCRLWHDVAIETSSLWTHIDLDTNVMISGQESRLLEYIRLRVKRAKGTPIHVHLPFGPSGALVDEDSYARLGSALQLQNTRILSIDTMLDSQLDLARRLLGTEATRSTPSSLQYLRIHLCPGETPDQLDWATYLFPGLVELDMYMIFGTALPPLSDFLACLAGTRCLRRLRLGGSNFSLGEQEYPYVSLPSLEVLELGSLRPEVLLALSSAIKPGELELNITIDLCSRGINNDVNSVTTLLARSHVVSLWLKQARSNQIKIFRSYLASVPHVRALILEASRKGLPSLLDEFALWVTGDSRHRLPSLQSFGISSTMLRYSSVSQIEKVIAATNLRSICFLGCTFTMAFVQSPLLLEEEDQVELEDMPESTKAWLEDTVGQVVLNDKWRSADSVAEGLARLA
ncbi:pyrolysin [Ceratobasidium sp. AG-Ba]|nr:pyrolysin [Ceratobasidium sp. AG-Ba]